MQYKTISLIFPEYGKKKLHLFEKSIFQIYKDDIKLPKDIKKSRILDNFPKFNNKKIYFRIKN